MKVIGQNMPLQVLDYNLRRIPATSDAEAHIARSCQLHGCLIKPVAPDAFETLVKRRG